MLFATFYGLSPKVMAAKTNKKSLTTHRMIAMFGLNRLKPVALCGLRGEQLGEVTTSLGTAKFWDSLV